MSRILFVDNDDKPIGSGTRKEATEKGIAHRLTRVYLHNAKSELLIARRSMLVDNHPGIWGESVAGHVDEGEDYLTTVRREMKEELGLVGLELREVGKFYAEDIEGKNVIRRFNMVYSALCGGEPTFDKDEVSEVRWIAPKKLEAWMNERPEDFTPGSRRAFKFLRDSGSGPE